MCAPSTPDAEAYLRLVTVRSVDEATAAFARYGIVRIPAFLSAEESEQLEAAASTHGLLRDAFGQRSQADRFTRWLAGDGSAAEEAAAASDVSAAVQLSAPCSMRAYLDEHSDWRSVARESGYGNLALAEVVTSMPGGRAQRWHFDGEGITAQVALVPICDAQGPTEVVPRPLPAWYVRASEDVSYGLTSCAEPLDALAFLLSKAPDLASMAVRRPLYDARSALHAAAWSALRPALQALGNIDTTASERITSELVDAGLTPPVVRLSADVGTLTLYDSAMVHRGGQNVGVTPRPILAVHLRAEGGYGPSAVPGSGTTNALADAAAVYGYGSSESES